SHQGRLARQRTRHEHDPAVRQVADRFAAKGRVGERNRNRLERHAGLHKRRRSARSQPGKRTGRSDWASTHACTVWPVAITTASVSRRTSYTKVKRTTPRSAACVSISSKSSK